MKKGQYMGSPLNCKYILFFCYPLGPASYTGAPGISVNGLLAGLLSPYPRLWLQRMAGYNREVDFSLPGPRNVRDLDRGSALAELPEDKSRFRERERRKVSRRNLMVDGRSSSCSARSWGSYPHCISSYANCF